MLLSSDTQKSLICTTNRMVNRCILIARNWEFWVAQLPGGRGCGSVNHSHSPVSQSCTGWNHKHCAHCIVKVYFLSSPCGESRIWGWWVIVYDYIIQIFMTSCQGQPCICNRFHKLISYKPHFACEDKIAWRPFFHLRDIYCKNKIMPSTTESFTNFGVTGKNWNCKLQDWCLHEVIC